MSDNTDLAALPRGPARRQVLAGVAMAVSGLILGSTQAHANADDPISHTTESIHQEVTFAASPKRVYEALSNAKQFQRVVELSNAMKTRMPAGAPPVQISQEAGGTFSMFGGIVTGRQIELLPGQRIVQAWRPMYWNPGVYSIVKFELAANGSGTKLTLDHRGFPDGDGKASSMAGTKTTGSPSKNSWPSRSAHRAASQSYGAPRFIWSAAACRRFR